MFLILFVSLVINGHLMRKKKKKKGGIFGRRLRANCNLLVPVQFIIPMYDRVIYIYIYIYVCVCIPSANPALNMGECPALVPCL